MKHHVLIVLLLVSTTWILYGQSEILNRRVRIENREGTIGFVLDEISRNGDFAFSYSQDIPQHKKVRLQYTNQTVQQYLDELSPSGRVSLL